MLVLCSSWRRDAEATEERPPPLDPLDEADPGGRPAGRQGPGSVSARDGFWLRRADLLQGTSNDNASLKLLAPPAINP